MILLRTLFNLVCLFKTSKWNSPSILRINKIYQNKKLANFLAVKMFLFNNFVKFMVTSLFVSIFTFSSLLIITEKPLSYQTDGKLDEWKEIIWYVCITMTTIGYGDKTAKTLPSRLLVMILVIWGNFWTTIFLSSIIPYIIFQLQE